MRVIIAEDEVLLREGLSHVLQDDGMEENDEVRIGCICNAVVRDDCKNPLRLNWILRF